MDWLGKGEFKSFQKRVGLVCRHGNYCPISDTLARRPDQAPESAGLPIAQAD